MSERKQKLTIAISTDYGIDDSEWELITHELKERVKRAGRECTDFCGRVYDTVVEVAVEERAR